MKKLIFIIALLLASVAGYSQLTLSEKSTLAQSSVFRARLYQALFSKANFWLGQTADNLQKQKQIEYAKVFVKGGAGGIDIGVVTNYFLAGFNNVNPQLDGNGQPIDSLILNAAQLDNVFNTLAGVVAGDNLLPVNP
jgi:hypothetical protein